MRQLTYSFSGTSLTAALVLSSFMGGMAIGSWLSGRLLARASSPLTLYAYLELGLGLCGVLYPTLIDGVGAAYVELARRWGGTGSGVKLVMFAGILVVPAILMGATLPAVVRLTVRDPRRAGNGVGLLYAVNSLGGVAGCLASGFWMVETIGLRASSTAGAIANLAAALGALGLRRWVEAAGAAGDSSPTDPAAVASGGSAPSPLRTRIAAVLLVSGFTAMGYEVLWARTLPLVLGSSTYSFALMLATFVAGISGGSLAYSLAARRLGDPVRVLAFSQAAIGAWVLLSMPLYGLLPYVFLFLRTALGSDFTFFKIAALTSSALAMAWPALLFGVGFPAAVQAGSCGDGGGTGGSGGPIARSVGDLYAANTAGNVLGALATGLVLIPGYGSPLTFQVCAILNLAAAAVLAIHCTSRPRSRVLAAVAVALALLLVPAKSRAWLEPLSMGAFSRVRTSNWTEVLRVVNRVGTFSAVHLEEDACAAVAVTGPPERRSLFVNGKVDATSFADMLQQTLIAHVPLLIHPDPRTVFILGLGSGATAGAALVHPVERVDCAELSAGVTRAARLFASVNGRPWDDPRFHLAIDDGRHFLQIQARAYDVIILEPSNPWLAGMTNVFTREFLLECRKHLKPGGLMLEWAHTYEIDQTSLHLIMRTFQDVFPHSRVFTIGSDVLMVGAAEARTLAAADVARRVRERLRIPRIAASLRSVGIQTAFSLLSMEVFDAATLPRWVGGGLILTDDHPELEFLAPVAYYRNDSVQVPRSHLPLADSCLAQLVAGRAPTVDELLDFARHAFRTGALKGLAEFLTAPGRPEDPRLLYQAARADLALGWHAPAFVRARAAWDREPANVQFGELCLEAALAADESQVTVLSPRTYARSRAAARALCGLEPVNAKRLVKLAELEVLAGEPGLAVPSLEAARRLLPAGGDDRFALARLWALVAAIRRDRGDVAGAQKAAEESIALDPGRRDGRELLVGNRRR
jgi:spermidine synthase